MLFKVESTADKIEKQGVKQMYLTVLQLLERRGFDLQPQNRGAVAGHFRGAKIISLYPQRTNFRVDIKRKEEWHKGIQITTSTDWITFVQTHLQLSISEVGFSARHYPVGDPSVNLADLAAPTLPATTTQRRRGVDLNDERYSEEYLRRLATDQIERRPNHMLDRRDGEEKFHSSPLRDDPDDLEDE